MKKRFRFEWGVAHEEAFLKMKEIVSDFNQNKLFDVQKLTSLK